MALNQWRDQDLEQLLEVAGRIAAVIQTSADRRSELARLTKAAERRDLLADLLIEYSGRWFAENNGQSILVGPELYWLLSAPDPTDFGRGSDGSSNGSAEVYGPPKRVRGMLLVCVLESLTRNQWAPETVGAEPASPPDLPHRQRPDVPVLNSTVVSLHPNAG